MLEHKLLPVVEDIPISLLTLGLFKSTYSAVQKPANLISYSTLAQFLLTIAFLFLFCLSLMVIIFLTPLVYL